MLFYGLRAVSQEVLLDPKVRTGKLGNGLTYYIRHNTEPKQWVTLYLVLKAGSILENENERGLAHFIEHMSFNGTKNFPKNQLVDYLQRSGIRFGADLNAYTSFEETVYQLPVPADDTAVLHNGLKIIRDWTQNATLETEEIEKERGVVLEEKRLRLGSSQRIQDKTFPVLVNHSRYANRLPIGTEAVVNNATPETIRSFYRDWYRPDLQAVIIVGDIDVDAMENEVKKLFSDLKTPSRLRTRPGHHISLNGKNTFRSVTDPEISQTTIQISIKHRQKRLKTEGDYLQGMQRILFLSMLNARFAERNKDPDVPFNGLSGNYNSLVSGLDALTIQVTPKKNEIKRCVEAAATEMERIRQYGFTNEELERAKRSFLSSVESSLKEKDKQSSASLADSYKNHFLKEEAAPGLEEEVELIKKLLPGITTTQMQAQCLALLKTTDRTTLIIAPLKEKSALPDEALLNSWIKGAAKRKIYPYEENFHNNSLLSFIPGKGRVVSEKITVETGTTEWKLSNGATVILKPTSFRNNDFRFLAISPGGSSLYSDADVESVSSAAGIVSYSGLGDHDNINLPKLLNGKQVSVVPFINERSEGVQGSSGVSDIETALQLMYLYFIAPRKDSITFARIVRNAHEKLRNRYADPGAMFNDTASALLGNYNPRRTAPDTAKLNSINLDKSLQFYRQRFANAGDFTFFFVGNFNTDSLKHFVEQYIASLPANATKETAKDLGIHIPGGRITKTVRAGKENRATVQLVFSDDYNFNASDNLKLSALSEILKNRLVERLREKEAGVYSPSVELEVSKYPRNRYVFLVSFGCAPANVESLINATLEEMQSMKTQVSSDELVKFKAEQKRQHELALQDNGFWLNYLSRQYINNDDPADLLVFGKMIDKLETNELQESAKIYFNNKNFIRLVLMPDANVEM